MDHEKAFEHFLKSRALDKEPKSIFIVQGKRPASSN